MKRVIKRKNSVVINVFQLGTKKPYLAQGSDVVSLFESSLEKQEGNQAKYCSAYKGINSYILSILAAEAHGCFGSIHKR